MSNVDSIKETISALEKSYKEREQYGIERRKQEPKFLDTELARITAKITDHKYWLRLYEKNG